MTVAEIGIVVILLVASAYGIVQKDWRASFVGVACASMWILVRLLAAHG